MTIRRWVLAGVALAAGGFVASEAAADWIAAAAANWRDDDGGPHAAIGYSGVRSTRAAAIASAMAACESAGGEGCKLANVADRGCVYISVVNTYDQAGWGSSGNADDAVTKCEEENEGVSCEPPIGGCVD